MKRLAVFLLLCLPLMGQGIISVSGRREPAGGGGCNEFTETDWDNLTGWTYDDSGSWTADSTNDELDWGAINDRGWIVNDTATTNDNHCVLWEYKDIDTANDYGAVILRGNNDADGTAAYLIGHDWSDGDVWWCVIALESGALGSNPWCDNGQGGTAPADGDYISACVTGTGTDTVATWWNHGSTYPGDCRSDWGTATLTFTGNPSPAVNTGDKVGVAPDNYNGSAQPMSFDNFVGSDY